MSRHWTRDVGVDIVMGAPGCVLGEGPVWDPDADQLVYVDILAGLVHIVRVVDSHAEVVRSVSVGRPVGAVARTDDGWVLAVRNGFERRDTDWTLVWSKDVLAADGDIRFNDASLDAHGRFFAGTMAESSAETGSLYRLDPDDSSRVVVPTAGASNGIDWSPDRRTMYFTDSAARVVNAYAYDEATGEVGDHEVFYRAPDDGSVPDGLAVDADGGLWIALWDGGRVIRVDQRGRVTDEVHIGVPRPTSLAFAGSDRARLYVTSASHELDEDQLAAAPDSGRLHTFVPQVHGLTEGKHSEVHPGR